MNCDLQTVSQLLFQFQSKKLKAVIFDMWRQWGGSKPFFPFLVSVKIDEIFL